MQKSLTFLVLLQRKCYFKDHLWIFIEIQFISPELLQLSGLSSEEPLLSQTLNKCTIFSINWTLVLSKQSTQKEFYIQPLKKYRNLSSKMMKDASIRSSCNTKMINKKLKEIRMINYPPPQCQSVMEKLFPNGITSKNTTNHKLKCMKSHCMSLLWRT